VAHFGWGCRGLLWVAVGCRGLLWGSSDSWKFNLVTYGKELDKGFGNWFGDEGVVIKWRVGWKVSTASGEEVVEWK